MSNSSLVNYTKLSPNKTSPRSHKIDRITIHHMAGNLTVEQCGNVFAPASRKASSNYAIGSDGRVGMYVEEKDRSWCSSSSSNDNRAVTIEVANSATGEPWPVSDKALNKLVDLCVDICKRNGIQKLVYTGDTRGNLTMHKWFAPTGCPGTYLSSKFPWIAEQVNKRLNGEQSDEMTPPESWDSLYRIRKSWKDAGSQIGAYRNLESAKKECKEGHSVYDENGNVVYSNNPGASKPSSDKITEDGIWGVNTTKKAQKVFGTGSDGIISNQLSCYQANCKGIVGTIQWSNTKRGGSLLIKTIQKHIGETPDGYLGPGTIKGIQRWQGCAADGVFSYPSPSIKAFQHWLNQQ